MYWLRARARNALPRTPRTLTRAPGRDRVLRMTKRLVLLALAAAGCTPSLIPGTGVEDTSDNRAVYQVVQTYREAMDRRDAAAVLALVAPDYFDTAGTPAPEDDVNHAILQERIPQDLGKVDAVKLDITVRKIDVKDDRAVAEVFYDGWYRVKTPTGAVPRRDSDVHRMKLRKVDERWLFTSGI